MAQAYPYSVVQGMAAFVRGWRSHPRTAKTVQPPGDEMALAVQLPGVKREMTLLNAVA